MADWHTIPDYFTLLSEQSDRVRLEVLTQGLNSAIKSLVSQNPCFSIRKGDLAGNTAYTDVARYPMQDILSCGLLNGEDVLRNQACLVRAAYGDGEIILLQALVQCPVPVIPGHWHPSAEKIAPILRKGAFFS